MQWIFYYDLFFSGNVLLVNNDLLEEKRKYYLMLFMGRGYVSSRSRIFRSKYILINFFVLPFLRINGNFLAVMKVVSAIPRNLFCTVIIRCFYIENCRTCIRTGGRTYELSSHVSLSMVQNKAANICYELHINLELKIFY